MILSKKYSILFVAIQKTGTTSIEEALLKYCSPYVASSTINIKKRKNFRYKHNSAEILRSCPEINSIWNDLFKFSFVRNPWDLCVSHYCYQKKQRYPATINKTFKQWLFEKSIYNPVMWQAPTQYDCLTVNKKLSMNFIGRFENLQEDFDHVCKLLSIPSLRLPHKNSTQHNFYSTYYDDESINYVKKLFHKDIVEFAYDFKT